MLLEFCLEKELCVSNTWLKKNENRKVTFRMGENETRIDFVFIKKKDRQFIKKHALVIADIDKNKIRKVVKKADRRKIGLLKDL